MQLLPQNIYKLIFISIVVILAIGSGWLLAQRAVDPDEASYYWYSNGKYYFKTGDIPKAIRALKKAIRFNPHNDLAQKLLLEIKKKYPYMETSLVNIDDTGPKGESYQWYVNAEYLFKKGLYEKALFSLDKSLKLNPYNIKALELKQKINQKLTFRKKTEQKNTPSPSLQEEDIEFSQDKVSLLLNSAKFYFKWKKYQKAYDILLKLQKLKNLPQDWKDLIEELLEKTKIALQRKTTSKKISNKSAYWFWLGKYYEKQKDYQKAYLCYQKASIGSQNPEITSAIDRMKEKLFFSSTSPSLIKPSDFEKELTFEVVPVASEKENNNNKPSDLSETLTDENSLISIDNTTTIQTQESDTETKDIDNSLLKDLVVDKGNIYLSIEVEDNFLNRLEKNFSYKNKNIFDLEAEKLTQIIFADKSEITATIPMPVPQENQYEKKFSRYNFREVIKKWKTMEHSPLKPTPSAPSNIPEFPQGKLPEDLKEKIRKYFEKGAALLEKKDEKNGLLNYRTAYITSLQEDPKDVVSLYNLMLIYYKEKRYKLASLLLFQLGSLLPKIQGNPKYYEISSLVKCWLNQIIIQSATNNYNLEVKRKKSLEEGKLNISYLIKTNFLPTPPVQNIVLELEWGNRQIKLIYDILDYKCNKGTYYLNRNHVVYCSLHRTSTFLLVSKRRMENEQVRTTTIPQKFRGYSKLLEKFGIK